MNKEYWMRHSIKLSKSADSKHLKVGAVLVLSETNEMIASSSNTRTSWVDDVLQSVDDLDALDAEHFDLYVTINTILGVEFEINRVLKRVSLDNIYVGLPDPQLTGYYDEDPVLRLDNVYRYPYDLQMEIFRQNEVFYNTSEQNIVGRSYY